MTNEQQGAYLQALLSAVGIRNQQAMNKVLSWLRTHPRAAAELLEPTSKDQVEYATRGKWQHKPRIHPDYDTAIAAAQKQADASGRVVEVWHRPRPDKFVLGIKVHPYGVEPYPLQADGSDMSAQ